MKNVINLTILTVLGVVLVLGCGQLPDTKGGATDQPSNTQAAKPISISAKELTRAYDENELAADQKYKGKLLSVSGTVSSIAETLGNVTVQLEGHEFMQSVMCSFEEEQKANVARLKKGQPIKLLGTGDGKTLGLYVGLEECRIDPYVSH